MPRSYRLQRDLQPFFSPLYFCHAVPLTAITEFGSFKTRTSFYSTKQKHSSVFRKPRKFIKLPHYSPHLSCNQIRSDNELLIIIIIMFRKD